MGAVESILVAIAMLICFLQFTGVSYETYSEAGSLVEFWFEAGCRGIGVPLYLQLRHDKETADADSDFAVGRLCGRAGFGDDYLNWWGLSGSDYVIGPKSVTTRLPWRYRNAVGGIPSLTAAVWSLWSDCLEQSVDLSCR